MSQVAGIHFKLLNPDPMSLVIDLHGLSVSQASAVTTAFLRHPSSTSRMVKLVTGVSRHSEGIGKLRPAIEALLKSMNLHYESEDAAFRVYLSTSRH